MVLDDDEEVVKKEEVEQSDEELEEGFKEWVGPPSVSGGKVLHVTNEFCIIYY